jgi:uncharacterized protein YodC (DUF2158 family)
MQVRRFKPGDRVQHRNGGQVMEVMKYVLERRPLVGEVCSDCLVECVWYDDGERQSEVFHQNVLTPVSDPKGLFPTSVDSKRKNSR